MECLDLHLNPERNHHEILLKDYTVHMVTKCPPFGKWGSLTLDTAISSYKITPVFFFILSVLLYMYTRERG